MTTTQGPLYSSEIDRLDWQALGVEGFRREMARSPRPVIIRGAFEHWPARSRWTLPYLRERWGDHPIDTRSVKMTLGEHISRVLASTPQAPAAYLHNYPLSDLPPQAREEVGRMPECSRPNFLENRLLHVVRGSAHEELYIGGAGAKFPFMHYDGAHTHAFLMQLHGVKEYLAFAPDQSAFMYPREGRLASNRSSITEIDAPDLQQFPAFAQARGMRFQLHPGETLFIPGGWWHTARIVTPSITVSVNAVNAANWRSYSQEFHLYYGDGRAWRDRLVTMWLKAVGPLLRLRG